MRAFGSQPQRKSRKPVTRDVPECILTTCSGSKTIDIRDRAILLIAFAAGRRRRREVASLKYSQLSVVDPIKLRPVDPTSPSVPCIRIALGRTKTTTAGHLRFAAGRVAIALREWQRAATSRPDQSSGKMDLSHHAGGPAISQPDPAKALPNGGLDPADFSDHGLWFGFMTQAGRDGVPLVDAMRQSAYESIQHAAGYYDEQEHAQSRSVRIDLWTCDKIFAAAKILPFSQGALNQGATPG
jgi:hypothetical protein